MVGYKAMYEMSVIQSMDIICWKMQILIKFVNPRTFIKTHEEKI